MGKSDCWGTGVISAELLVGFSDCKGDLSVVQYSLPKETVFGTTEMNTATSQILQVTYSWRLNFSLGPEN